MSNHSTNWSKTSWQEKEVKQQPKWPDQEHYNAAIDQLSTLPPLVEAGEIQTLKKRLAKAAQGEAFLLQGGDCAEEFALCNGQVIKRTLKVLLQMAVILTYAGEKEVIKVGRIAGQYGKPRSADMETIDGVELPSYRGDIVNRAEFVEKGRIPDANNLLQAYHYSATTLNLLRAFTRGGFASLDRVHKWNMDYVKESPQGKRYEELSQQIDHAIRFMKVIGLDPDSLPQLKELEYYTSHEALILGYETALTRRNTESEGKEWYDCSAHMLWIGDRTRQKDGAHIEFLRGVENPIGMKVGPKHDIDEILEILDILNPKNEWGKITLITRFGDGNVKKHLPQLIRAIEKAGKRVLWSCDPMHGNTFLSETNYKTRNLDSILAEIHQFFEVHREEGTVAGGIHCELTGLDVTECVGGSGKVGGEFKMLTDEHLEHMYLTSCDPRLNGQQSIDLAFEIAEMLRKK
ncbi:MAG: 3-deoxy-7-phosphoheptulonate synthase [bacterium]|jgi:3-deoxy-7-phosphoheptulonate synthase